MEVKEITAESIKTLENLTSAVHYYREISEEISRLELSKKVARESILGKFQEIGLRYFDTDSGLRARADTREGREWIDVKEAKSLLDPDTLEKLLKKGETIIILSVRPIKSEE